MSATSPPPTRATSLPNANGPPPGFSGNGRPAGQLRPILSVLAIGIAIFFGLRYLVHDLASESTDDAFIDGHVVSIAARVPGEVFQTHITENQEIKSGDLLVELDPKDYEVRVKQKRSSLESAQANQRAFAGGFDLMRARVITAEATRKQSDAQADASKSSYDIAEADWNRALGMWTNTDRKIISQQDYETAKAAMTTAKANWEADLQKAASDASKVTEARAQLDATERLYEGAGAQVALAQADLQAAELELSYTKITAPVDGRVTRKMVEKGAYIQAGQTLLAIVRPEIWVTANFKETQTARIRPGQAVDIEVDGLTNRVLHGHVDSLQSGSGARFSLLPPENAVGNYVKVVQRVPVKILFDDPVRAAEGLGPGMSVSPAVRVGKNMVSDFGVAVISIVLALAAGVVIHFALQRNQKKQALP